MPKKKSYMNKENILSEGFFDKFKKGLFKLLKVTDDSRAAKKAWRDVDKALSKSEQSLRKLAKELGMDYDEMEKEGRDVMSRIR